MSNQKIDPDHDSKVEIVRNGGRISSKSAIHKDQQPGLCAHSHGWRPILCNFVTDVIECPDCGMQRVTECNFDEDFA